VAGEGDERALVDLITEQLEFADVIVLNKIDRVGPEEKRTALSLIRALNPVAHIVESEFGKVPLSEVLDTRRFSFERAEAISGWARELAGLHTPETEAYGIDSFVYRARRPFHPGRLMALFNTDWPGVVRSKGFFWLATRMNWVGEMSQAGGMLQHQAAGFWWAVAPEAEQAVARERSGVEWDARFGDRRQELVFIGIGMDEMALRARLDRCLLTDAEMRLGPAGWRRLPDPFPTWRVAKEEAGAGDA
jgi:G3E family GTPase